jgi:hypothetical protein
VAIPPRSASAAAALDGGDQGLNAAPRASDPGPVALLREAEVAGGVVAAGRGSKGERDEYRCAACGYGIIVYRQPPSCPMCRERRWEHVEWRPFSQLVEFPLAELTSVGRSVSRLAGAAPAASGQ